ncbi:MAG: hypothetical protein MMC23_008840 [Stictis urceolatum]|nr:hypothetical protein [Stictis urceolata]
MLVAIHQDGTTRCLTENLQREIWTSRIDLGLHQVQSVHWLSLEHARTTIFQDREDLTIRLEALQASNLLFMITKSTECKETEQETAAQVRILIPHWSKQSSTLTSSGGWMEELAVLAIPESQVPREQEAIFHLHKPTGCLIRQSLDSLTIFDVTSTAVRIRHVVPVREPVVSCLILSSVTVAVTTYQSILILDTKYGSVKASHVLNHNPEEEPKTVLGGDEVFSNCTKLVAYSSALSTAFAVRGREIEAFQLNSSSDRDNPRKSVKHSTLAEAMGRGIGLGANVYGPPQAPYIPPQFGKLLLLEDDNDKWQKAEKKLRRAARKGDATKFDKIASKHLQISRNSGTTPPEPKHRRKIYAMLDMLFTLAPAPKDDNNGKHKLKLSMIPPVTFGWLVEHGLFMQSTVEVALKHSGQLSVVEGLLPSSLVDAVYEADPSLQTLIFILSSPQNFAAHETVKTILRALQYFQQAHSLANKTKLLTGTDDPQDIKMKDSEEGFEGANGYPSPEPDSDKIHDAHALMRICLSRLVTHNSSDIQAAFSSTMPQASVFDFIDYLRLDLASGGWFSHYDETNLDFDGVVDQPADHLRTVCLLLNAAINSLGIGAWLSTSSRNDVTNTITHMKAEVAVACEAVTNARYLQGLLHDVLLYAKNDPPVPLSEALGKGKRKRNETTIAADGTKMVKPITIRAIDQELNYLPIGLKPRGHLSGIKEKTNPDGKVEQRSMRDIGRLKSMQVGAYSFERIMI